MNGIHRIVLVSLATAFPLMCIAGDEVRYNFECDTPAAHFSHWSRSVSSTEIEIAGKVTMKVAREDKKWLPIANILLRTSNDRNGRFGIRFFVSSKTPNALTLELLKVGGHDAIGKGSIPLSKKPIPFTLRLDASGLLTATVAGAEASTMLGTFAPKTFELNCSTSEFNFTDITVREKVPRSD